LTFNVQSFAYELQSKLFTTEKTFLKVVSLSSHMNFVFILNFCLRISASAGHYTIVPSMEKGHRLNNDSEVKVLRTFEFSASAGFGYLYMYKKVKRPYLYESRSSTNKGLFLRPNIQSNINKSLSHKVDQCKNIDE
jgi:hypothetical protein